MGFPCGSAGKESACNAGDLGSIPGLGRPPGEGKRYPLQYSGLENSRDYAVLGVTKSRTRLGNFQFHTDVYVQMHIHTAWRRPWQPTPVFHTIFNAPNTKGCPAPEAGAPSPLGAIRTSDCEQAGTPRWSWGIMRTQGKLCLFLLPLLLVVRFPGNIRSFLSNHTHTPRRTGGWQNALHSLCLTD